MPVPKLKLTVPSREIPVAFAELFEAVMFKLPLLVLMVVLVNVTVPLVVCDDARLTLRSLELEVILIPDRVIDASALNVNVALPPDVLLIFPDDQVIFPAAVPEPAVVIVTSVPLFNAVCIDPLLTVPAPAPVGVKGLALILVVALELIVTSFGSISH